MSTLLASFEDLDIAQFCGKNNQLMLQISNNHEDRLNGNAGYIQLNKQQTYQVVIELTKWLKDQAVKDKERIQAIIAENKVLEKSILQDAVDCEKFLSDLKIIDLPLRLLEMK